MPHTPFKPYRWKGQQPPRLVLALTRGGDFRHYARPVIGQTRFQTLCGHDADRTRTRDRLRAGGGVLRAPDCRQCALDLRDRIA